MVNTPSLGQLRRMWKSTRGAPASDWELWGAGHSHKGHPCPQKEDGDTPVSARLRKATPYLRDDGIQAVGPPGVVHRV